MALVRVRYPAMPPPDLIVSTFAGAGMANAHEGGRMTVTETAGGAEQSALRRTAQRRTKQRLAVLAATLAGWTALSIIAFGWNEGPDAPVASTLLIAAGVAFVVAGILVIAWAVQKRIKNAPLMLGSDKATQQAVRAAVRRGHTDDPNVHTLVLDLIKRSHTPRWLPYVYLALAAFFLALLFMGDRDTEDVIRTVVLVVVMLMVSGGFWLHLRHLRNYRGLAHTTQHHD
jgi:peptidoglycan/LPS O-acetylase OafA/YrhL